MAGLLLAGVLAGFVSWAGWIALAADAAFAVWMTRMMIRGGRLRLESSPFYVFGLFGGGGIVILVGYFIGLAFAASGHGGA